MEESFRPQDDHTDHNQEDRAFLPDDVVKSTDPALHHAERERCDNGAWNIPKPTDDHKREGLKDYGLPHARLHQLDGRKRAAPQTTKGCRKRDGIARYGTRS